MAARREFISSDLIKFSIRERDKIGSILSLFAKKSNGIYMTRMMKFLYIVDEESIKEIGVPVLPFDYNVAEKGPLILELWNLFKEGFKDFEKYISFTNIDGNILIKSVSEPNLCRFSEYELELIDTVYDKYLHVSTDDIIDYLHTHPSSLWKKKVEEHNIDFSVKKISSHSIDFKEHVNGDETNKHFFETYHSSRK